MGECHPSKPSVKAMSRRAFLGPVQSDLPRRHWLAALLTLRKRETCRKLKTISPQLRHLTRTFSRLIIVLLEPFIVSNFPAAERRNSTNSDRFGA
jgi:hypothetical protein